MLKSYFIKSTIVSKNQRDSVIRHEEGHQKDFQCIAATFPSEKILKKKVGLF